MNDFFFNTFTWAVIGFIVAYVSHLLGWSSKRGGIFSTLLFGLVGAFIGGILANVFLGQTIWGVSIPGILFAAVAIAILATLQKFFLPKQKNHDDYFYTIP